MSHKRLSIVLTLLVPGLESGQVEGPKRHGITMSVAAFMSETSKLRKLCPIIPRLSNLIQSSSTPGPLAALCMQSERVHQGHR